MEEESKMDISKNNHNNLDFFNMTPMEQFAVIDKQKDLNESSVNLKNEQFKVHWHPNINGFEKVSQADLSESLSIKCCGKEYFEQCQGK